MTNGVFDGRWQTWKVKALPLHPAMLAVGERCLMPIAKQSFVELADRARAICQKIVKAAAGIP